MSLIRFNFLEPATLSSRNQIRETLVTMFKAEHTALESLEYVFCSDDYLLDMNKRFLNHDYYTDVITFVLSQPAEPVEAEVYISVDRVRENAKTHRVSVQNELLRVIFHGALHLCGYKDKTKAQITEMRQAEERYLLKRST